MHAFSWCLRSWSIFLIVKIDQCLTFLHFRNWFLNNSLFPLFLAIIWILLCMNNWLIKSSMNLILSLSFHLFSTILSLGKFLNCSFMKLLTFSKFLQKYFSIIWFFYKDLSISRLINLLFSSYCRLKFGFFFQITSFDFIFAKRCEALIKLIVFF